LEAASVEGVQFSAAGAAAGLETLTVIIEERCAALARRGQFVQVRGVEEWPDWTVAGRYGFRHALYQQVIYDRLGWHTVPGWRRSARKQGRLKSGSAS
jgi:hypothetical protein